VSSTTPTSPLQRAHDVSAFVAAVRGRLDDLAPDEVEELTGGLEADLAEALSGHDESPRERFGDPVAYADELRAAADLPPRREPVAGGGLTGAWQGLRASVDAQFDAMERLPWYGPVRDFLVTLRPAWWVLRAWLAVALVRQMLGANETGIIGSFPAFVVLLLAIVGSVTLGRRTPLRTAPGRAALLLGNVVAVLAFFPVIGQFAEPPGSYYEESWTQQSGLWNDGGPVEDILPYDSQGRPLTGVALYDRWGNPLDLNADYAAPNTAPGPPLPGNVFPKGVAGDLPGQPTPGVVAPTEEPTDDGGSSSVGPSSGPAAATPSAAPSVTPSGTPIVTPSAGSSATTPVVTPAP
jgi:hypothetical protein